jgi:hypothetical protein
MANGLFLGDVRIFVACRLSRCLRLNEGVVQSVKKLGYFDDERHVIDSACVIPSASEPFLVVLRLI